MDEEELLQVLLTFNMTKAEFKAEDNLTEEDTGIKQQLIRYYVMGIGGMILCCLGIIGNILSSIVLTRKVMKSSTYIYLAALAVCDTLNLFFTILILIRDTKYTEGETPSTDPNYARMFPIVHPLAITFQVTSIWLTLAFTVDRYIMICHPFRAERWCSNSRAVKVIISLYIAGLIFTIPRYLEYTTKIVNDNLTIHYGNVSETKLPPKIEIELTELGKNDLYRELVHSWTYLTCVCGLPFLLLAYLNAFLVRAVHISRQKGKEINANERRRNDTTVMLIGVVVIFLICQGPALISRMIWALDIQTATTQPSYLIINEVANLLVIMNSAINIVPYYFFGQKFRKEFWRLFCSCFLNKEELRLLARRLSFSIDNHRRPSPVSCNGNIFNDINQPSDTDNSNFRKTSSTPFLNDRIVPRDKYSNQLEIPLNSLHSNCVYKKDQS